MGMVKDQSANGTVEQTVRMPLKGKERSFEQKDTIYKPSQRAKAIYEVESGRVKVVIQRDRKEIIKKIAHPGDVIGLCALGKRRTYCEQAICLCDSKVKEIPLESISEAIKEDSKMSFRLNQLLIDEIYMMDGRIRSMAFDNARQRVIQCLLNIIEKEGERIGYEYLIRHALTHQEMASLTATSRQTVTSVLNELKDQEIIKFNRQRILINDLSALENYES
jgi:CRP-like cAMP-binding protein